MPTDPTPTAIAPWLRELLRCPATGEQLVDGIDADGTPCLESPAAGTAYPVRDGVPILLIDEARPL